MATHCVADHLQSLTLISATPFLSISMLTDILHSVTFPSLKILEIHGCQIGSNTTIRDFDGALLAFILRSTCPLDCLKLHEVPLSKDGLVEVFVLLRSLHCLEIDGFNATSPGSRLGIDFLRGLAYPDNNNGVRSLPRLNRFSLSCSLEESEFVVPLESVNLHMKSRGELPDNFNSRLRILASSGMKIQINGENLKEINSETQRS